MSRPKKNPWVRGGNGQAPWEVQEENRLDAAATTIRTQAYARALRELRGEGLRIGKQIGRGSYASVYELEDHPDLVLKLTTDTTEAAAAQVVLQDPELRRMSGVPKVVAVFEMSLSHPFENGVDRLYGIIVERLRTDVDVGSDAFFVRDALYRDNRGLDPDRIEYALSNTPPERHGTMMRFADSLMAMQKRGVWPRDLLSRGNILTRGPDDFWQRDYVVADLGVAHAPEVEIPWHDEWFAKFKLNPKPKPKPKSKPKPKPKSDAAKKRIKRRMMR